MLGVASALYKTLTLNDDIQTLVCDGGGIIQKGVIINNIERLLRKRDRELLNALDLRGFRDCTECNRGDCDDCERGYCSDCTRGNCSNCTDYNTGYEEGYDNGYNTGHADGYRDGDTEGYKEGYATGMQDAVRAIYQWLSNNHLLSSDITLNDLEEVVNDN
jgi:hypothetical protein